MSSGPVKRRRSGTINVPVQPNQNGLPSQPRLHNDGGQLQPHDALVNIPQGNPSAIIKRQRVNEGNNSSRSVESSAQVASAKESSHSQIGRPPYRLDLANKGLLVRGSLGSGSYSKVKLALDISSNPKQFVAVKIVDRKKAPSDYVQHFLPREVRIWSRLNCVNLVKLLNVFEANQRVYMMLEYVDGGDVLTYIQNNGAVGEDVAKSWVTQICSAVRYMHDRNISHRDLKLENLLLTDFNKVIKICDFGFIKEVASSEELSQTFCGSKAYAAPEILQGQMYDPKKSDIWAIGVITYIFLTGKMPFDESRGTKKILEDQLALKLHWNSATRVNAPSHNLIIRMLSWRFADRPPIAKIQKADWFTS